MTTSGKMFSQYLGACVAALPLVLGLTACGGDNVAAEPTPKTVTVTSSPEPATPPPSSTAPASPSSTPPSKTAKPTPPAKATPTKPPITKPTITSKPGQIILYPILGDPPGTDVGIGGLTGDQGCIRANTDRKELKIGGSRTILGSQITVTKTASGMVITTDTVFPAKAFIANGKATALLGEVLRNPKNRPSAYQLLLPKKLWETAVSGPVHTIIACAFPKE